MPSAADRSTPTPLSGRRVLSRIASPFASKSRSITDFLIEVDDPHKQHSPGDTVTGSVRLRVLKPTRITHLVVCLHGFVQVYKHPGSPGEGFRANSAYLGTGRGRKSGEYFGNGFASLFEDEIVLCGDGRLAEGSYQFNFELEFPGKALPSSIDFERGTISYMVTATITRPTSISPIVTCDHKVYLVEPIDIAPFYPPKPRTITLEPLSKRTRARHQARKLVDTSERRSRKTDSTAPSDHSRQSRASSTPSTVTDGEASLSPAPSEISFDSLGSSQRGTSQPGSGSRPSPVNSDTAQSSLSNKTITATVESLTGGCLRGDFIGIKVNINHTKPIRSLYGAIVTLFRQARVDMHPAIPLGPTEKGVKDKHEDYYPKSLTGLGGLSLSGAGSSHVFRKDLAQVMVPLYVDPTTLTAEVSARVRVPEEAFPTISTTPGAMISFKYYVEVVLDIQGKLGGVDRNMGDVGGLFAEPQMGGLDGAQQQPIVSAMGATIVDTAPIRRDKGVVTCTFEVVVGTRDSERRKGKRKAEPVPEPEPQQQTPVGSGAQIHDQNATDASYFWQGQEGTYHDPGWYQQQQEYSGPYPTSHYISSGYTDARHNERLPPVPVPQMPDESGLSEKERMRRAEERLLPSQPPGIDDLDNESREATAPYLHDHYDQELHPESGPSSPLAGSAPRSAEPVDVQGHLGNTNRHQEAIAPEYEPPTPGSSSHTVVPVDDDKHEIRRRQLLEMESSAPRGDEEASPSDAVQGLEPTAPTADEADEHGARAYDSHADAAGSSGLPRYER